MADNVVSGRWQAALLLAAAFAAVAPWPLPAGADGWALQQAGARLAVPPSLFPSGRLRLEESPAPAPASRSGVGRYALPMALSALVPGSGEIVSGHLWNGLPLLAADVATWIGYFHYEDQGDEWKEKYEAFADSYWNEARWQQNLEAASTQSPNPWDSYWDPAAPYNCDCSPPYIPRAEDEREYYENLGKYNHFYPGWDDWTTSYDPESPAAHRRQFVDMRIESNDAYDNADTLLGVAAATRIVSVIQSFWLVRRDSRREGLYLEPMTFGGFGSGMRLKWSF